MTANRHYGVFAGGEIGKEWLSFPASEDTIWIAADSGANALLKKGMVPDLLIGDLDSIDPQVLGKIKGSSQTEIFQFPAEKDFSDTYLAFRAVQMLEQGGPQKITKEWTAYHIPANTSKLCRKWEQVAEDGNNCLTTNGIKKGSERLLPQVTVFGGSGSRQDHSLANYAIAFSFLKDMDMIFRNSNGIVYPITGGKGITVKPQEEYPYWSIFPLSGRLQGLTLSGFRYPLSQADIAQENASLLLSNEITEDSATIYLKEGKCLVFQVCD